MENELDETKEELSSKTTALAQTQSKLDSALSRADVAEKERQDSKEEQGKMRHRLELAQSHACETIEDYKALEVQYVTIEEKHRNSSAHEKDLRQTLTDLRHSYQRLDMELVQGQLQRKALEKKNAELEHDRKALRELRKGHAELEEEVERM